MRKSKAKSLQESLLEADAEFFQANKRDVYYSILVREIINNNNTTQTLKYVFFSVVCAVFALVSILGIVAICIIACKEHIDYSEITIALSSLGGILSAIIVLPKIIAKHLFPENSEEVRFNFVTANQKMDLGSPEYIDTDELLGEGEEDDEDDKEDEEDDNVKDVEENENED